MQSGEIIIICLLLVVIGLGVLLLLRQGRAGERREAQQREMMEKGNRELRMELSDTIQNSVNGMGRSIAENQERASQQLSKALSERQDAQNKLVFNMSKDMELKLENIRGTVQNSLTSMQNDNNKKLDEMRGIVDEKLQKTLNERLQQSFKLVNDQLEQVHRGLGEMQKLAQGVGDLSKVLSNVKTRGILGEVQLGAILEEMLAPEQYEKNVITNTQTRNPVEYALKLPGDGERAVLLPIDAKFPMDAYVGLNDAYESGNPEAVKAAASTLTQRIKSFAKDIHTKYIDPPNTTNFAIMFLPTEGLYAEAVKLGLVEVLQREYQVNICGPSTMAAYLNSLQMGFRTLAIQKRSSEVWQVLGEVKTEFGKFESVLHQTKKKLDSANSELEKLIGTRTNAINRKLRNIEALPVGESEDSPALESVELLEEEYIIEDDD